VPIDVRIAGGEGVRDGRIDGDVPVVLGPGAVVHAVGAVERVGGIEAVGVNVIPVQIDAVAGHHPFAEDEVLPRLHADAAAEIAHGRTGGAAARGQQRS